MPVVAYDPSAANTPTRVTVHVWECVDHPGDFALCTNPQLPGYHATAWQYRGELPNAVELDGFPRPIIVKGTINGWPMIIRTGPQETYSF